jgi:hypothetical protein
MEHVLGLTAVLRRVRHSRMLLAGIQAESGLDPRLKHSGVTVLESHVFARAVIFEGGHEDDEGLANNVLNFVRTTMLENFRSSRKFGPISYPIYKGFSRQ